MKIEYHTTALGSEVCTLKDGEFTVSTLCDDMEITLDERRAKAYDVANTAMLRIKSE